MKIAVISDIHGNLEAFNAVMDDIGNREIDDIICLGDIIGYGPDPEAVVRRIRDLKIKTIMGNHELGLFDEKERRMFNATALKGVAITESLLSRESMDFLQRLPDNRIDHGCCFVHGFPPDDNNTYLFQKSNKALSKVFQTLDQDLVFVGHTHELEIDAWDGKRVERWSLAQEEVDLDREKYIINAGSVGQPRDGDNRAKYIIWDQEKRIITVRFVAYDIKSTADKIIKLGFPKFYASRLL